MSSTTQVFNFSNTPSGQGSFPLPPYLLGSTVRIYAAGGQGGQGGQGQPGNGPSQVAGTILASLLPVKFILGQSADAQGDAASGFSGGGGGGSWYYLTGPEAWEYGFFGGGGAGSTAVMDPTGATLYMEAGGGDGGTYTFGPSTAGPSRYPGGSGGGAQSGTPANATGAGEGAGSGGSGGGSGASSLSGNGGFGRGGTAPLDGIPPSGQESGQGVGSGTFVTGTSAGAVSFNSSNLTSVNYGVATISPGSVEFFYSVVDAPTAPTLFSPTAGVMPYVDAFDQGVTFTATYNTPSADTGPLGAVALQLDSLWWDPNSLTFHSSTPIFFPPSTGLGFTTGEDFTVVIPPGIISDGVSHTWLMETQEALYGQDSPASTSAAFTAVTAPTVVITQPAATVTTLTPTIAWTPTVPGGTQATYQFVIYTSHQTMPNNTTLPPYPAPTPVWNSGQVATPTGSPQSFQVPPGYLNSVAKYYGYLQITGSLGAVNSLWTEVVFTVELLSSDTVTLTALPVSDPASGLPSAQLVMTISASDLLLAEFQGNYGPDGSFVDIPAGLQTIVSETVTVYDLGAPYNTPLYYRARAVGTIGGQQYVTNWSTSVPVSEIPSIQWAAVAPTNLAGSLALHRLPSSGGSTSSESIASPTTPAMPGSTVASFISDEWEQLGTFHPFGKSTATIVHGDLWQPAFTLDLFFLSSAEWAAFRAIRQLQQVVLLKSDMEGTTYWVTLGPDLNPGIMSEMDRQINPERGLTVQCTPTDPYVPPNPYIPTN